MPVPPDSIRRSRSPTVPASRPQTVESLAHANSYEPPSRQASAQWEGDYQGQGNSNFAYGPNYQDSYSSYGSPSSNWNTMDGSQMQRPDGVLSDNGQLDYNPADFDPHAGLHSPFLFDGEMAQSGPTSKLPADFLSGGHSSADLGHGSTMISEPDKNGNYAFTEEPLPDLNPGAAAAYTSLHPRRGGSGHFDGRFSPRPDNAPSPASSAGLPEQDHYARSRASSVSSFRHTSPALLGNIPEAFDRLQFDAVDSDLAWRNQQGGPAKAASPPQLMIPNEPQNPNSLQIPSFGQPTLTTSGPGFDGGGGLSAPSINLLPATPVSGGGAGSTHVPFQQVLKNLTEQRQPAGNPNGAGAPASNSYSGPSSRPSTPGHHQSQGSVDFTFPQNTTTFTFPSGSPSIQPAPLDQGLGNFFPPRQRSYSDASRHPIPHEHPSLATMGAPHPSIGSTYSPHMGALAPPLSSMSRNIASNRSSPFSTSSDSLPVQYSPVPPPADLGMGVPSASPFDTGLIVGQRHRSSRSEDFGRGSPFAPPQMLQPSYSPGPYGYHAHESVGIPSSIGPTRSSRRGSHSSHHERAASGSSFRMSPYPSPSGSPAMLPGSLPGTPGMGSESGMNPWSKVERQQVTTPATAKASEGRRKGEATFVCPVPGCHSTFTRHFNLKGHLRSHNEERPFKCKWPGCEKGFARQHDCKRHEALHLNLRPYTCDGCKKTFARMDALNRHLKSEGGVDCARAQGPVDGSGFDLSAVKDEYNQGWAKPLRSNGAVVM